MLAHRNFAKLVAVLTAAAVCLSLLAAATGDFLVEALGGKGVTMEYESALFDTDKVLDINIRIDEDDWQTMLDNAINEEYVSCFPTDLPARSAAARPSPMSAFARRATPACPRS